MISSESFTLENVATIIAIAGGLVSIAFGARQILVNARINRARFWLEFRRMISEHQEVNEKLRPIGEWHGSSTHPTNEEMPQVEAYMGLLEHCEDMLKQKLIDFATFKAVYGYRVDNIMTNPRIVKAKLIDNEPYWLRFIALAKRLGYTRKGNQYTTN